MICCVTVTNEQDCMPRRLQCVTSLQRCSRSPSCLAWSMQHTMRAPAYWCSTAHRSFYTYSYIHTCICFLFFFFLFFSFFLLEKYNNIKYNIFQFFFKKIIDFTRTLCCLAFNLRNVRPAWREEGGGNSGLERTHHTEEQLDRSAQQRHTREDL